MDIHVLHFSANGMKCRVTAERGHLVTGLSHAAQARHPSRTKLTAHAWCSEPARGLGGPGRTAWACGIVHAWKAQKLRRLVMKMCSEKRFA